MASKFTYHDALAWVNEIAHREMLERAETDSPASQYDIAMEILVFGIMQVLELHPERVTLGDREWFEKLAVALEIENSEPWGRM